MTALRQQEETDSLLLHQLPTTITQISRPRTITRKKKGIVRFFGAKETVQIPLATAPLHTLNKELISLHVIE